MPFPRQTLTQLRTQAMQDVTGSDLPNANGFLRASVLRVMAWVQAGIGYLHFGYLDWISRQSTPMTSTDEYLDGWAAIAPTPVIRESPNYAQGPVAWPATATGMLPGGTLVLGPGNQQYATIANAPSAGLQCAVNVIALFPGSAGNLDTGAPMALASGVNGVNSAGATTGPITGGTDLEEDDSLRSRMLESYGAPPHGGDASDFVTWALEVPGVTRAWVPEVPLVPGAVTVFFMMDASEAAFNGFPQGTNGVAALETRDVTATGDQLTVANFLFPLRPMPSLVYAVAPTPLTVNLTLEGLTGISIAQQNQIVAALTAMFPLIDSPLATTPLEQNEISDAIEAIGGLPNFAVTSPSAWPVTSAIGQLFELGAISYTP